MSLEKLKSEFNKVAEITAQLTQDLKSEISNLKKNELFRVFTATMEYPVSPEKPFVSQKEVDVYKMATGLKEMQMKLGIINLAIREQESKNGEDNESV